MLATLIDTLLPQEQEKSLACSKEPKPGIRPVEHVQGSMQEAKQAACPVHADIVPVGYAW